MCLLLSAVGLLLTPAEVHCKRRSVRFCDVWAGAYVTYAKAHGTGDIYTWGLNNYFQLGKHLWSMCFLGICIEFDAFFDLHKKILRNAIEFNMEKF